MATLVNKVRAITGSSVTESTNDKIIEFINDSFGFVVSHIPKELLSPYASETSFVSSTGIAHGNNVILGVRRGNYEAKEVDKKDAGWIEAGSGSYLVPTNEFPKWYERGGMVYLKPNPSSTGIGYLNYIATPTITTGTENILGNLETIVIDNSAGYDFKSMGNYYSASSRSAITSASAEIALANAQVDSVGSIFSGGAIDDAITYALTEIAEAVTLTDGTSSDIKTALDAVNTALDKFRDSNGDPSVFGDEDVYTTGVGLTRVKDALDNAQNLIDGTVTTNNAIEWLNDEDSEMVNSILQTAQTEMQRAQVNIADFTATIDALMKEAQGFANEANSRYGWIQAKANVWNGYLQTVQSYYNEINARLQSAQGYLGTANSYLQNAQMYMNNSQMYYAEGDKMFNKAIQAIELYIKNSSEMIAIQSRGQ